MCAENGSGTYCRFGFNARSMNPKALDLAPGCCFAKVFLVVPIIIEEGLDWRHPPRKSRAKPCEKLSSGTGVVDD
eukprot:IDg1638t1